MTQEAKTTTNGEIQEGKIYAFVGYWGILCLIPLLAKKDNKFALYHGKQGLVLFITDIIVGILGGLIPIVGWFVIAPIGGLFVLILAIIGMVKSLSGEYWKMPLLGGFAEKIKI